MACWKLRGFLTPGLAMMGKVEVKADPSLFSYSQFMGQLLGQGFYNLKNHFFTSEGNVRYEDPFLIISNYKVLLE